MVVDYFHIQFPPALDLLISMEQVLEVMTLTQEDICPIPGVKSELLGVVNHRGQLLWILDLGELWGLNSQGLRRRSTDKLTLVVMTTRTPHSSTGHRVHQWGGVITHLQGIVSLPEHHPTPLYPTLPTLLAPFVAKTAEVEETPMAVLDSQAVFEYLHTAIRPTVMV